MGVGRLRCLWRGRRPEKPAAEDHDEDQEPGCRDEVHKAVADGLVLVEVDAIVGKVELAATAGVWRTFDVCAGRRAAVNEPKLPSENGSDVSALLGFVLATCSDLFQHGITHSQMAAIQPP